MDIKEYREHVKTLASLRTGTPPIYNGSPEHAAIVVEQMFASAQSTVKIVTGDLNARVYGTRGVVQRAREFLGHSDHSLEILVEHQTFSDSHPLLEELAGQRNFVISLIPPSVSEILEYHFMTADNDCFRFEAEKNSHAAVAAFGDKETAAHLNGIFETLNAASRTIDIPRSRAELADLS
ncbi:MAG TPA: hypothetical protein VF645_14400 [Allosphingosinicella sp.]|jgi:hypothetical protein